MDGQHASRGKASRAEPGDARRRFVQPDVEQPQFPALPVIITTVVALIVLGLTVVALSDRRGDGPGSGQTRAASSPTASPSAAKLPSSVPPTARQAEGLEFRGMSSGVVGPIELRAGDYRVGWRARAVADRCVFGALLRPVDGGTLALIPAVSGPHQATLYGSAQSTLDGGWYFLDVTGSSCEWRIAFEANAEAVSPSPSS